MDLTTDILSLRPYLFGIAYNMLAVVEEAEDMVQDVYEKWLLVKDAKVPKAYLGRMVVNRSIDRLNELKKNRESYKGEWLPEPYITLEQDAVPSLEYGLLFLLERLNPSERAVFILREGFSEEYNTIAELTGLSTDNCRQLLHRAHEKLARSKAEPVDPAKRLALTEAFVYALGGRDINALSQLLRSDIELFSDGGGKRAAALKPLFGLQKVLKFLDGVMSLPDSQDDFEYKPAYVNGSPCALIFRRSTGELDSMQYIEADEQVITRLLYVRNPDKLKIKDCFL
jgi:RNA polymerase sigma-70 factor (ECF subfamily)